MKLKDKLIYGATMLPLIPYKVFADTFYGGLTIEDGSIVVGNMTDSASIVGVDNTTTALESFTNTSNNLVLLAKIVVGLGVVIAGISVAYSGIQYANSLKAGSKESAKMRLTYSCIAVALLGGLGLLINASFNIFS